MSQWETRKLTEGSADSRFHAHSYYDIRVFDSTSRYIAGHRMRFAERPPTADDQIDIGIIDLAGDDQWTTVGSSSAWSWQQGPMAQWVPGRAQLVWNDREGPRFVTRLYDVETGSTRTLARPTYAIDPSAQFALSLNMARLDAVRPGYGYVGGRGAQLRNRHSRRDGVWRQSLDGGDPRLVLSLHRAVQFLYSQLGLRSSLRYRLNHYRYWFNHVKLSPDGTRFTVKLRYRRTGRNSPWNDNMGVSLTCGVDGKDLRLLTNATSHVIWLDDQNLYLWRKDGFYLYRDAAPRGYEVRQIARGFLGKNAHVRYLPGSTDRFVYDTPYQEDIDLLIHDEAQVSEEVIAHFSNHRPKNGQYRCDLHPCPSPDGQKIVVTSLDDGGRQIYLMEHRS